MEVMSLCSAGAPRQSLERVLFVFAIRHPASGYVQGINDIVVPFYAIFLREHIGALANWV
jgi:hypothetical protein